MKNDINYMSNKHTHTYTQQNKKFECPNILCTQKVQGFCHIVVHNMYVFV